MFPTTAFPMTDISDMYYTFYCAAMRLFPQVLLNFPLQTLCFVDRSHQAIRPSLYFYRTKCHICLNFGGNFRLFVKSDITAKNSVKTDLFCLFVRALGCSYDSKTLVLHSGRHCTQLGALQWRFRDCFKCVYRHRKRCCHLGFW